MHNQIEKKFKTGNSSLSKLGEILTKTKESLYLQKRTLKIEQEICTRINSKYRDAESELYTVIGQFKTVYHTYRIGKKNQTDENVQQKNKRSFNQKVQNLEKKCSRITSKFEKETFEMIHLMEPESATD